MLIIYGFLDFVTCYDGQLSLIVVVFGLGNVALIYEMCFPI